ncbi:MarR family winged helix-turn-helix transcriptional regulator [Paracoccus sediminicola]|uniref:MarR family winged helix-turn-helix transcriptional regulator n=1 Tax=Paracoccus sediminicola TaxID=3017783 RepID=UPI0022F004A8|nr:MarR family transcriptional regulator [Paracoccus sediminicola]WBU56247.1 MarR family transcriptional regulator [Paracoccus sediminicola]
MDSTPSVLSRAESAIDLERLPSFLLNHIVHQYHQTLQSRLRPAGVSTLKMRILISLKSHGQLTVTELCNYAIAEQPTMSRALDSLEAQGMVQRQPCREDSRIRLVTLTESGRELSERVYPEVARTNDGMLAGLSESESAELIRSLRHVLANLRER